jgi:hypothetical protein
MDTLRMTEPTLSGFAAAWHARLALFWRVEDEKHHYEEDKNEQAASHRMTRSTILSESFGPGCNPLLTTLTKYAQ